jgi:hypothetical protein
MAIFYSRDIKRVNANLQSIFQSPISSGADTPNGSATFEQTVMNNYVEDNESHVARAVKSADDVEDHIMKMTGCTVSTFRLLRPGYLISCEGGKKSARLFARASGSSEPELIQIL